MVSIYIDIIVNSEKLFPSELSVLGRERIFIDDNSFQMKCKKGIKSIIGIYRAQPLIDDI